MKPGILIVGVGALATLFAARLSAAGVEVTMLGTWEEGLAALHTRGARIEGEGYFPVRVTDNPIDCRGIRYALILVKSWQTERAARQLLDCLPEDGLVVTLQNGLGNDEILGMFLGRTRILCSVTTLGATLLAPGYVRLSGAGNITLESHPNLIGLDGNLRAAGFEVHVVKDMLPVVWGKLVVNAAINPLSALLRVKNGALLEIPPARELLGELACETASVAKALGVALPFPFPECAAEEVASHTSDNISSMLQDVLRGAPTEVDAINGAVVREGRRMKVQTPVNQVVSSLIKALPIRDKI